MSKSLSWTGLTAHRPLDRLWRVAAAGVLRTASAALARAARRLRRAPVERAPKVREIEFQMLYRDAGAPEGALYVDGELVAVLPVSRL